MSRPKSFWTPVFTGVTAWGTFYEFVYFERVNNSMRSPIDEQKPMLPPGYEVRHYTHDLEDQVVDCLSSLLGNHTEENLSYFRWKYLENPYAERPLGIVTLFRKRVVGFRGYFATRWSITGASQSFIMLSPGDTCVHPDHRRGGLSVAMGHSAMREYESQYRVFLNTSAGADSTPGYLKMGFVPLAQKGEAVRFNGEPRFMTVCKKRSTE